MDRIRHIVYVGVSLIGGLAVNLLGGWDILLQSLIVLMIVDFFTGWAVGITGKSKKTETGTLSSATCFVGLVKKTVMLTIIIVCVVIDNLIGSNNFVRSPCIMAFCINESLSIIENAAVLGIPMPEALKKSLDILKEKGGDPK